MDNRARRAVVPVLATVMLLSTAAPAFALSTNEIGALTYGSQQVEIIQTVPISDDLVILAKGSDEQGTPDWTDWKPGPWWYGRPSAIYSWQKLYVKGIPNGDGTTRFGGDQLVQVNQFATVLVRMTVSEADKAKFIAVDRERWVKQQLLLESDVDGKRTRADFEAIYDAGKTGRNWAAQDMSIAEQVGLLDGLANYGDGEGVCGRGQMAQIIANALALRGENTSDINVTKSINYMADSEDISNSTYSKAIGIAIGSGIISGVGGNKFDPSGTMDRASMCELFLRIDDQAKRTEVLKSVQDIAATNPDTGRLPNRPGSSVNTPITIDMREYNFDYFGHNDWDVLSPNAPVHREPREGDTVINLAGDSIVLTRTYGVLGFGQGVSPYLGTMCNLSPTGYGGMVFDGTFGIFENQQGMSDPLASGAYLKCKVPGFENERHFVAEWTAIKQESYPSVNGKDGQVDSTGLWKYSNLLGSWEWQGPRNV